MKQFVSTVTTGVTGTSVLRGAVIKEALTLQLLLRLHIILRKTAFQKGPGNFKGSTEVGVLSTLGFSSREVEKTEGSKN